MKLKFVLIVSLLFVCGCSFNAFINGQWENPDEGNKRIIQRDNFKLYNKDKIIIDITNKNYSWIYRNNNINNATFSMYPLINTDTIEIFENINEETEFNIGDVIVFEKNNEKIIHRIIKDKKDNEGKYYITKGDNNFLSDYWDFGKIRRNDIVRKLVMVIY